MRSPSLYAAALTSAISATISPLATAAPSLTIYNRDFALVREQVPMSLKPGENVVSFDGVTSMAETDSVLLRDPSGKSGLQVLEQSYRNDPMSQSLLLSLNEGKTIDFVVRESQKPDRVIQGKIVRSGYSPGGRSREPVVEVDGKLQFSLPGEPRFPDLGNDSILNPTLSWILRSDVESSIAAELAYLTRGLSWKADYVISGEEGGDMVDVVGWITFSNSSGHTFRGAQVKLMAGDVNRVVPEMMVDAMEGGMVASFAKSASPPVTEKAFSEYHLYTLARPVDLRDQETKQVEFLRGDGVKAERLFVYDGASVGFGCFPQMTSPGDYGPSQNKKVWVLREFNNSEKNGLGLPLPKGRVRFYEREGSGPPEFVGENEIDHTPKGETVRLYVGNSFDLTGERKMVDFAADTANRRSRESYEITLRNQKKIPVEVRVVEHLIRSANWELDAGDSQFRKLDSSTVEFPVRVEPGGESSIKFTISYSW